MGAAGGSESETKLRVERAETARERLARAGATRVRPRHFEDNLLFDDQRGSLAQAGVVLRLRRARAAGRPGEAGAAGGEDLADAAEAWLTFKGPRGVAGGIKTREEIELRVPDAGALQAIFERLGFRPRFRYQKYRETWRLGALEVVVDETPIGCFLEIEGPPEAIPGAARALGYSEADFIGESYVALFFAGGGTGDMVFR